MAVVDEKFVKVSLKQYLDKGKWIVLLFYPFDFTFVSEHMHRLHPARPVLSVRFSRPRPLSLRSFCVLLPLIFSLQLPH